MPGAMRALPCPKPDSTEVDWDTGAIMGSGIGGMETIAGEVVPMVNAGKVRRMGSTIVEHGHEQLDERQDRRSTRPRATR